MLHHKLPKNGGVSGKQRQVKQADSWNSLAGMPNAQSSSNCPDSGSTPTKTIHHLMWHAPMKSAAHYLFGVSNGEVPPSGVLPQQWPSPHPQSGHPQTGRMECQLRLGLLCQPCHHGPGTRRMKDAARIVRTHGLLCYTSHYITPHTTHTTPHHTTPHYTTPHHDTALQLTSTSPHLTIPHLIIHTYYTSSHAQHNDLTLAVT